jgi:hypothetical protein
MSMYMYKIIYVNLNLAHLIKSSKILNSNMLNLC